MGFKKGFRVTQGSFKGVSREIYRCQVYFKEVQRVFQGSIKGILGVSQECFKDEGISRVFQSFLRNGSKVLQGCFKDA